jgi:hypothetical protein
VRLARHGIGIDLPGGWEGRIYRRPEGNPILHAANFALPARDGDFGTGATKDMPDGGVLVVLAEFDPALAGTGLFEPHGLPLPLRGADASRKAMARMVPNRSAIQRFFTASGRAFTVYVVAVIEPSTDHLVRHASDILLTVTIEARP